MGGSCSRALGLNFGEQLNWKVVATPLEILRKKNHLVPAGEVLRDSNGASEPQLKQRVCLHCSLQCSVEMT